MPESIFGQERIFMVMFSLVALWIIGVVALFIRLLCKYTFGEWETEKNPRRNPYANETLAMPRGVFRGMLTLSLLFMVMLFEAANLLYDESMEKHYEQLMVAFQMMLAFYFGSKVMHHITKADQRKSDRLAETIAETPKRVPAATEPREFLDNAAVG